MNKIVTKICSIILVICAVFTVCACGKTKTPQVEVVTVTEIVTVTEPSLETEPISEEIIVEPNTDEVVQITEIVEVTQIVQVTEPYQENSTSSGLVFVLNEDGVSYALAQCYPVVSGKVVIPATYNGKPVTKIGDYAFEKCTNVTEVVIPEGIVSIGKCCFSGSGVTHLEIPDSVTNIAYNALVPMKSVTYRGKTYIQYDENADELNALFGETVWNGYITPPTFADLTAPQ